jgi:uncharacterized protein (DUF433 family)
METIEDRIKIHPDVRSGQPRIRGTRTTVADVLGLLAAGAPEDEILDDFAWLTAEDIRAVLAYAAREMREHAARLL